MNILCITHADFESPGIIESWAKMNEYSFTILKPYKKETIPESNDFDLLIVMGGPQSTIQIEGTPYLLKEIKLIQEFLKLNKPILGFCLGAQLIGTALGGQCEKSPEKEIGVFPVSLTKEGSKDPLTKNLPQSFPVIHWHSDMPPLVDGAIILATSEGCPRQLIKYKSNVYGFQFHMEIDLDGIKLLIQEAKEDLVPSRFTQDVSKLISWNYSKINDMMFDILDQFISLTFAQYS